MTNGQVGIVTSCGEAVAAIVGLEASEGLPNGVPQVWDSAGRRGSEQTLQSGGNLRDRIEGRAVGREEMACCRFGEHRPKLIGLGSRTGQG